MVNMKRTLMKLSLVGILALSGCEINSTPPYFAFVFNPKPQPKVVEVGANNEVIEQLEGVIVKVQPSILSFSYMNANINAVHEFEYVFVEERNGKLYTLIYPHSKGILEGEATIHYTKLDNRKISAKELIVNSTKLNKELVYADDSFSIEADGIILEGKLKYGK